MTPALRGAILAALLAGPADAACRQALALGLDVSGSVDAHEYRLQLDGLANALLAPAVRDALLAFPDAPVRLYVYEWAGQDSRRAIVPWTVIDGPGTLAAVADRLTATPRTPHDPTTALGDAMIHGANQIATQSDCWRRTLDISGDGKSNTGPRPREVKESGLLRDVTVNALVVGSSGAGRTYLTRGDIAELTAYFVAEVIHGADAFIETAIGFEDFQAAMERKLLRELKTLAVGSLRAPRVQ